MPELQWFHGLPMKCTHVGASLFEATKGQNCFEALEVRHTGAEGLFQHRAAVTCSSQENPKRADQGLTISPVYKLPLSP